MTILFYLYFLQCKPIVRTTITRSLLLNKEKLPALLNKRLERILIFPDFFTFWSVNRLCYCQHKDIQNSTKIRCIHFRDNTLEPVYKYVLSIPTPGDGVKSREDQTVGFEIRTTLDLVEQHSPVLCYWSFPNVWIVQQNNSTLLEKICVSSLVQFYVCVCVFVYVRARVCACACVCAENRRQHFCAVQKKCTVHCATSNTVPVERLKLETCIQ